MYVYVCMPEGIGLTSRPERRVRELPGEGGPEDASAGLLSAYTAGAAILVALTEEPRAAPGGVSKQ